MSASQRAIAHIHAAAHEAGISHDHLHGWAVALHYDSTKDMTDDELDAMARRIKADPDVMAAWFDAYEPIPFEQMAPDENADPGDSSMIRHLFTAEQEAELHAAADRIQRREHYTQ